MKFKDKEVDFSVPKVTGVINVTPDSFYDGGRIKDDRDLLEAAEKMLGEGADFLDVGGCSSRPGATEVSPEEEKQRVVLAIKRVARKFPEAVISVDTFRAEIAAAAISAGAAFVNDISAGDDDPEMFSTVAKLQVPYIAMHRQGKSATMQKNPTYQDVVGEIFSYLRDKVEKLRSLGIEDVIIDPGFGFGKTLEHNYVLLKRLGELKKIGAPVMVGLSRKSMIQRVLDVPADDALNGTTAANLLALLAGADILRVHDVKPAKEVIAIFGQFKKAK
ncbi:dihydropteroate synthase [Patescibacteria group bacterium]|nr:dihydropteroate synthase [Patescibacteria group bacterium]